jgi:CheY-like chemotaxis protein
VLVVEDEPLVRAHAVRSLRAAGYDVAEASGPEPALALVASGGPPIDLLVTDVVMPRMGGPELAARLRSSRPDLPVLFTSGYTDRAGELRGAPGTDASFLPKPFTPGELSLAVRELLDRRRMGSRPPT